MGVPIAVALPVRPGQEDRVRNFGAEVEQHKEEFERLNSEATVTRYVTYLQESPMGSLAITLLEADDPSKIRRIIPGETPYDNWWLDYLRDVHGIDLRSIPLEMQPTPPPIVYTWP